MVMLAPASTGVSKARTQVTAAGAMSSVALTTSSVCVMWESNSLSVDFRLGSRPRSWKARASGVSVANTGPSRSPRAASLLLTMVSAINS